MKCYKCKSKLIRGEKECSKCGTTLKEIRKNIWIKRLIKLLILLAIIGVIVGIVKINETIQKNFNNKQIKLTSFENSSKTGDTLFTVKEKINNIDGEIFTFGNMESGHIKLYVENLVLLDQDISDKKFSIKNPELVVGFNELDVSFVIDGKEYKRIFYIYNQSEANLGSLDSKDPDGDQIPNYLEEAFKTNKNSKDSDNDGLTDYEEIYMTVTDPANPKTNGEILDSKYDTDGDRVINSEEISRYNTDPAKPDTDGDGLDDGYEIQYNSDPLKYDTDEDGISDYDEVMNYASSPTKKDTVVSGNIYNKDNVLVTMQNIKVEDLNKISVVEGGYALLNEKLDGYIMPPYKINTEIQGTKIISFNLNEKELKDNAIPTIYEIDSKTQNYKELQTYVSNGNVYSAYAENKDNLYMVFDKNALTKEFKGIKVGETEVEIEVPKYTHYMITDIPIAHLFVKDSIKIFCYGDFDAETHKEIEKIIESEVDGLVDIEFIEINGLVYEAGKKIQEWATDAIFNHLDEDDKDMIEDLQCINPESKGKKVVEVGVIADFVGIEDLEKYFYGDNKGRLSTNIKVRKNLDEGKDSNDDGLSDVITELIIAGKIKTEEDYNPFEGLTLEQINKNADFDNDTLKNGDEIKVVEKDGFYVLEMYSDPTKKDTDDDGIIDPKDPYRLVSFDSRYVLRNSLQGEPTNVYAKMKEVEELNGLFGTGTVVPMRAGTEESKKYGGYIKFTDTDGIVKYNFPYNVFNLSYPMMRSLTILGDYIGLDDAAKAEARYRDASGETYTEKDMCDNFSTVPEIRKYMDIEIENYKKLAEQAVADGETLIFENKDCHTASAYGKSIDGPLGFYKDLQAMFFLGNSDNDTITEISNNNGIYHMKMRYFIEDIYDWARQTAWYQLLVEHSEVAYFNMLLMGDARSFLVHVEYDMDIVYNSNTGETNVVNIDYPIFK
ncbi:MAG: hypothetical protein J6M60_02170 [Clostridia bacterium]|nr:hypothetical protein [Clostridia bacterium]